VGGDLNQSLPIERKRKLGWKRTIFESEESEVEECQFVYAED
jgi:hypothetical protein